MLFFNSVAFWGLLALAIPIIVHFFNFWKPKSVLFSNVALVREVQTRIIRRTTLQRYLLLLFRLLAIAAVVVAFANPVIVNQQDTAALNQSRSIVVIVDDSYSMTASDAGGNLLQQAKYLATELVKSYPAGDEFQVQVLSHLRFQNTFTTQNEAIKQIQDINNQESGISHLSILTRLADLFAASRNPVRQVYFFSDFQRSTILGDTTKTALIIPNDISVSYVTLGKTKNPNVYISDIQLNKRILEVGKPIDLDITLNNDSDQEIQNLTLHLEVAGKAAAVSSESIQANEQKKAVLSFTPAQAGWISAKLTLDDSPIEFDNTRYASFWVPERGNILFVAGGDENARYLRYVYEHLLPQFSIKFISEKELPTKSLEQVQGIVLAGVTELSAGVQERLVSFTENGGGLLIFPPMKQEPTGINQLLATVHGGKFITNVHYGSPQAIKTPDLQHPVFEGIFQKTTAKSVFDSPTISHLWQYEPGKEGIQGTILQTNLSAIVLQEIKYQNGQVFVFTTFPDLIYNDFPLKSVFAPIIHRLSMLMTQTAHPQLSYVLGEAAPHKLQLKREDIVKIKNEAGSEWIPQQFFQNQTLNLRFDELQLVPGNYQLWLKDSLLEKISFNSSDRESKLANVTSNELTTFLRDVGISGVRVMGGSPDQIREYVSQQQEGTPLWKYFIWIAAGCLLLETITARWQTIQAWTLSIRPKLKT
ncbi:MAG: BatA and WFA domain-containing protein [Bacteroidia bacterium]|nr:BatA and WFA domain-containing protein [Bacteroidia bacterium]